MNARNWTFHRLFSLSFLLLICLLFAGSERSQQQIVKAATPPPAFSGKALVLQTSTWVIKKIFPQQELIPGIGYRTTALVVQEEVTKKVYCLDPGKAIPPVGTQCVLKLNGVFDCGDAYQRFVEIPSAPTPTPTPAPTPTPVRFDCTQLGLGLQVTYGKPQSSDLSTTDLVRDKHSWRQFSLDPLAVAPDETWNTDPISMVYPNKTCGRFTVGGRPSGLPPEVVKIEVTIDCPGLHVDLSAAASDGGYCFDCRDINFNQKQCTVTNKLYIERGDQAAVCQAFYLVIDPLAKMTQQRFSQTVLVLTQP